MSDKKQTISPLMFSNIKPPKKNKEIRLIAEDKDQYLYFNPDGEHNTYTSKTEIEIIPNSTAREILYVTGPSGSGKSYYASKYVQKFCEIFEESKILLFSRKTSDPAFDENKRIKRIQINDELCDANVDILQACKENTLLIFDDIDSLEKKYWDCVAKMMYDILEVGRSYKLYCIITSHLINSNNKKFSRIILNESHWVVFFPKTNIRGNKYFLENYIGLEKDSIKDILNIQTRAIAVYRNFPNFYVSKYQIAPLVSDIHKNSTVKKEIEDNSKPIDPSLVS